MTFPFTNLVFEGAGVRNCAYAGAMLALEERGVFGQVEQVAGTSSGSIVATLVSLGYTPAEIRQEVLNLDFAGIQDGNLLTGPVRMFRQYGWSPGDYFLASMEKVIARKTGDGRITFAQHRARGFKPLYVVGTNLSARDVRVFPDERSQDMAVADAVRISMSIPFFFASREFQGEIYVDGGVMWNYPIDLFDGPEGYNARTLGFFLDTFDQPKPDPIHNLHDFTGSFFASLISSQEIDLMNSPANLARSIRIDDLGIKPTEFDITREQKLALMQQGEQAVRAFLERHAASHSAA
ncbi:patatin-like phospholipase family protein [Archangium violaceum]|uniref:patatin-like phospholipase family protein n=1 Tax=Archangium violaceum TaxID=83451 RepID=UPI001363E696|nr:patatin-like phospholipase family protein [Archangium violaceum]